jgi:hypothetical protein
MGRDNSVGTVMDHLLDDKGSIPGRGKRLFLFSTRSRTTPGPNQTPIQWVAMEFRRE